MSIFSVDGQVAVGGLKAHEPADADLASQQHADVDAERVAPGRRFDGLLRDGHGRSAGTFGNRRARDHVLRQLSVRRAHERHDVDLVGHWNDVGDGNPDERFAALQAGNRSGDDARLIEGDRVGNTGRVGRRRRRPTGARSSCRPRRCSTRDIRRRGRRTRRPCETGWFRRWRPLRTSPDESAVVKSFDLPCPPIFTLKNPRSCHCEDLGGTRSSADEQQPTRQYRDLLNHSPLTAVKLRSRTADTSCKVDFSNFRPRQRVRYYSARFVATWVDSVRRLPTSEAGQA